LPFCSYVAALDWKMQQNKIPLEKKIDLQCSMYISVKNVAHIYGVASRNPQNA
jgi:hypothetical protein